MLCRRGPLVLPDGRSKNVVLGVVAAVEDLNFRVSRAQHVARNQLFRSRFWMDGLEAGIRGIGESSRLQEAINRGLIVLEDEMVQRLHLRFRPSLGYYRR